jgi:hypothetical protein
VDFEQKLRAPAQIRENAGTVDSEQNKVEGKISQSVE